MFELIEQVELPPGAVNLVMGPAADHYPHPHLLGIEGLTPGEITLILDRAQHYAEKNRSADKTSNILAGATVVNLFYENSTRTLTSFELAAKRLGADVINMTVGTSSVKKGETLIDTAMTLNAMNPDALVVRHGDSGAVKLLSEKVNCAVLNAGDGRHEHPTQALLDALTIRRHKGRLHRLNVAICGDIAHSRVARSNILLLVTMGVMALSGLSLRISTVFIFAMCMGVVVDDTIHFVFRLREELKEHPDDLELAITNAVSDVGHALVTTTFILCIGFSVLIFASMNTVVYFGTLLVFSIWGALLADLLFLPALIYRFQAKR